MATQWPLVLFTFFICLSCGIFAVLAYLSLKGKGEAIQLPGSIAVLVTLAIGGIAVFFHLQHWERIFNGFGHITSGITHELIGCVVIGVLVVIWIVLLRTNRPITKGLAWVTIICAAAMVAVTGHSYMMPSRPAWGIDLVVYYLAEACLLGSVGVWAIAAWKKDEDAIAMSIDFTFVSSILQLVGIAFYVICTAFSKVTNYAYYADPTRITTTPVHVDSLLGEMVSGSGAAMFWVSVVLAIAALVCAMMAKKNADKKATFMIVVAAAALVAGITFRVLFYNLGYSLFMLY